MNKYRKKPVVIEAVKFTYTNFDEIKKFTKEFYPCKPDIFGKTYEKVADEK